MSHTPKKTYFFITILILAIACVGFVFIRPVYLAVMDSDYTFPSTPVGEFVQAPSASMSDSQKLTVSWSVPKNTYTNHYIEFKSANDTGISANSEFSTIDTDETSTISIILNGPDSFHQLEPGVYDYQITSTNYTTNQTIISNVYQFTIK